MYAAIKAHTSLSVLGGNLIPRPEAADFFSESAHEGQEAQPPFPPFLLPQLMEAPSSLEDPDFARARDSEKARQNRNFVGTSFMNTGQLLLARLR